MYHSIKDEGIAQIIGIYQKGEWGFRGGKLWFHNTRKAPKISSYLKKGIIF